MNLYFIFSKISVQKGVLVFGTPVIMYFLYHHDNMPINHKISFFIFFITLLGND